MRVRVRVRVGLGLGLGGVGRRSTLPWRSCGYYPQERGLTADAVDEGGGDGGRTLAYDVKGVLVAPAAHEHLALVVVAALALDPDLGVFVAGHVGDEGAETV